MEARERLVANIEPKGVDRWKLLIRVHWSTNVDLTEAEVLEKIKEHMERIKK